MLTDLVESSIVKWNILNSVWILWKSLTQSAVKLLSVFVKPLYFLSSNNAGVKSNEE